MRSKRFTHKLNKRLQAIMRGMPFIARLPLQDRADA